MLEIQNRPCVPGLMIFNSLFFCIDRPASQIIIAGVPAIII